MVAGSEHSRCAPSTVNEQHQSRGELFRMSSLYLTRKVSEFRQHVALVLQGNGVGWMLKVGELERRSSERTTQPVGVNGAVGDGSKIASSCARGVGWLVVMVCSHVQKLSLVR